MDALVILTVKMHFKWSIVKKKLLRKTPQKQNQNIH